MASSHHGVPEEERSRQAKLYHQFARQRTGHWKRDWPQGRISGDDEGSLALMVAADPEHNVVWIEFGKAVKWLGLPPSEAAKLGEMLIQKAREIAREPLTVIL